MNFGWIFWILALSFFKATLEKLVPQTIDKIVCQKSSQLGQGFKSFKWIEGFQLRNNVLESTSYPLSLASKSSLTEWYCMQNLLERQLSSVCLVEPFWLAVK